MCFQCAEKYPQLSPSVSKPDENSSREEIPVDRRRRTSECSSQSNESRQQKIPGQSAPSRSRSDSLPSQRPRQQQQRPHPQQNGQMRPEQSQGRPPQSSDDSQPKQIRPEHPNQSSTRSQQQPRSRYSSEQPRPPHPMEQNRFHHPGDHQRFPHPMDQQRPQHSIDQQRSQHPTDQPRPQHPKDQPRPQHPMEQSRSHHPMDKQRPQHPMDKQRPQHSIDQPRPQHPMDQPRPQHPMDQTRPQHPMDEQRSQHPSDQPRPQHPMDQPRPQHPMDQPRPQHPMDQPRPQHPMDQPRPQHPMDQPRPQHPSAQSRSQHTVDHVRPPHPMDQVKPPHTNESHMSQQIKESQRLQQAVDERNLHTAEHHRQRVSETQDGNPEIISQLTDLRPQNQKQQKLEQYIESQKGQHPGSQQKFNKDSQKTQHSSDKQEIQNNRESLRNQHANDMHRSQNTNDFTKQQHPNDYPRDHPIFDQQRQQQHIAERQQAEFLKSQKQIDQQKLHGNNQKLLDHNGQQHLVNKLNQFMTNDLQQKRENNIQHDFQNSFQSQPLFETGEKIRCKEYSNNEPPKPRPQHPITHPPSKSQIVDLPPENLQEHPQQIQEYSPQRDANVIDPYQKFPQRNQRLREPPDQQIMPKPQHPQQPPQEFLQMQQGKAQGPIYGRENTHDPHFNQERAMLEHAARNQQNQQVPPGKQQQVPTHGYPKPSNGQVNLENYRDTDQCNQENVRLPHARQSMNEYKKNQKEKNVQPNMGNLADSFPQEHPQQRHQQMEANRQLILQPSNGTRQPSSNENLHNRSQMDNEKNGIYVSLVDQKMSQEQTPFPVKDDFASPTPPATLPRTKPLEPPPPAVRSSRREKMAGNQTLPKTGTNPFRSDTNPFRRESLPQEILDAGEYVTVAARRGSLDERLRHISTQEQAKPAESMKIDMKVLKISDATRKNIRFMDGKNCETLAYTEQQDLFEKYANGAFDNNGAEAITAANSDRHLEEEQRRNAINSGVYSPEVNSRRQLPSPQKRQSDPHSDQRQMPPVPKTRTSVPDTNLYNECRNGIPRTVPLTSVAQWQNEQTLSHGKQKDSNDEMNMLEQDKHFINDLSQLKQNNNALGMSKNEQQKQREDLVHPNIVDTSVKMGGSRETQKISDNSSRSIAPSVHDRNKIDQMRDNANAEPNRRHPGGQQIWPEENRAYKPMPPEDNNQDLDGYQDEEEEEDIDDYFQMIENAVGERKPQVIVGGRRTADIQRQLLANEANKKQSVTPAQDYSLQKGHVSSTLHELDAFSQNPLYESRGMSSSKAYGNIYEQRNSRESIKDKNDLNMYEQDKILSSKKDFYGANDGSCSARDKKVTQYIIQPNEQKFGQQSGSDDYNKQKREHEKLLMHELTPDTRQPSANHYLEEHKTQPVSYEAFSSAKALKQTQDTQQDYHHVSSQQIAPQNAESRSQQYYYSQQNSGVPHQSAGQVGNDYDADIDKGNQSIPPKQLQIDQKKVKPKPDPQDWSPVSDLSPILDVSPSVEAAEQELMEKFQEKIVIQDEDEDYMDDTDDSRLLKAGGIPRATSGTISGMLEEFTRALGLPGTSPIDDSGIKTAVSPTSLAISPISNVSSCVSTAPALQKEYQEGFGSPQKTTPGGSPQKTVPQPTTPRRSHRRLPQPTVEQMQAAVAMAAQGPREKSPQPPCTTGAMLFGGDAKPATGGRPVSPMMPWKSPDISQSFEQAYNKQQTGGQTEPENGTAVPPSPAPRAAPRGNDVSKGSECLQQVTNSVVQEVPTPQARKLRSASYGGSPSKLSDELVARLNGGGSSSPHATSNGFTDFIATTVGSPQTPSTPRDKQAGDSDTQSEAESIKSVRLRRKLPNLPPDQCPSPSPTRKTLERSRNGSTELDDAAEAETAALTPAAAITITTTVTTALEVSRQYSPAPILGAPSPTPLSGNLSPLLGKRTELSRTPSPGGEASGTKLPQYMQSLKKQLRDELKAVTEERKIMLEQRGKERGEGEGSHTPQPLTPVHQPPAGSRRDLETLSKSGSQSPYPPQSPHQKQTQAQLVVQNRSPSQTLSQVPTTPQTPYQAQERTIQQIQSKLQSQTNATLQQRTPTQPQQQNLMYQSQLHFGQNQPTSYQIQQFNLHGVNPEQSIYHTLPDTGRRTPQPSPARTPLPDAVPPYSGSHRFQDDDITIMTTATTTVVSASEQWHDGTKRYRQPPTTTIAPSTAIMGASIESLRRLQPKMSPQPSPKKGRRRHTSEINIPPFPVMDQYQEMAHTIYHAPMRQQRPTTPQSVQYYTQVPAQQPASYRSMEFGYVDSHARAAELLRTSASRYGGSLGSGLSSTEALYQGRRVLNNRMQDYVTDNRMQDYATDNRMQEQQQRLVGPDVYFQTLNNEINKLRRSSESLHRDTMYDKSAWGMSAGPVQGQMPETRTSPQTTERRKRKEKKSRKPRSWHPSPYVSEDEDDQMTREEKKAKIKAEIARRRQQIEENMRLHDELCKLAERRDRMESSRPGSVVPGYAPSPTGSVAYRTSEQTLIAPVRQPDSEDTSSVLKAIDEILRKDLYSGPLSRSAWATYSPAEARSSDFYQSGYITMPRNRYEYDGNTEIQAANSWYDEQPQQQQQHVGYYQETNEDPEMDMDESIARIASTFPTDEPPDILLSATPGHFSPEHEMTPAMPLLPDMPTRSRKLLENLGSSPIQPSRSGSAQSLYQDHHHPEDENNDDDSLGHRMQESSSLLRAQRKAGRAPASKASQKYDFPVKRILLTRDPKDRSVSGNGLGMKVVGGKEVPGSNGMIGAYVAKIFPGGVVETLGEVKEGDQVLEWNGVPLTGRTYEEVQRIIASSADEVEIVIRCDLNMLETMNRQRRSSPGMGTSGGPRGGLEPPDTPGSGSGPGRGSSPAHSPYSPAGSSRGHSPALSKRGMGGSGNGGGGNMMGNNVHNVLMANLNGASSYENISTSYRQNSGYGHTQGFGLNNAPISRSIVSVFAPNNLPTDWPDMYDSGLYSSPQSPDDFIEEDIQSRWHPESNLEQVQFQVCCGPRTAIVYVPIIPMRPLIKSAPPAILDRSSFTRRSVDHIDEYEPLLKNGWRTEERSLGIYDLLRPRNSLGKMSLYLNNLKGKVEVYEMNKKNGMSRMSEEIQEEPRERPRAPSDLPGLRPVFVNDWKRPKKVLKGKVEENDDNNNSKSNSNQNGGTDKQRKPHVGYSPEATPYNILPKGCRGSFCVIL
ncbi:uncharacterized protein LOC129227616 [Uloborus diversus]|uniref:uncharacterized protein LOC129227616 n=1 Tax=Uloborus diversus TaxID=327109 RepID=UPI0024090702|nr:uncharacterized protein LOC129227616 [Uloborus diversus]